jgi:hypothetical protein
LASLVGDEDFGCLDVVGDAAGRRRGLKGGVSLGSAGLLWVSAGERFRNGRVRAEKWRLTEKTVATTGGIPPVRDHGYDTE